MRNEAFEAAGLTVFERGWLSSNNVLFGGDGSHASVLVDSGYWTHASQTLAMVAQALGPRQLDRIVNTHLHSDHCGGNAALQQKYGLAIDVPIGEREKVDRWDETTLTLVGPEQPVFSPRPVDELSALLARRARASARVGQ